MAIEFDFNQYSRKKRLDIFNSLKAPKKSWKITNDEHNHETRTNKGKNKAMLETNIPLDIHANILNNTGKSQCTIIQTAIHHAKEILAQLYKDASVTKEKGVGC